MSESIALENIIALGFQACRSTNGHKKHPDYDFETDKVKTPATKTVLSELVKNGTTPDPADLDSAEALRGYFQQKLMLKALKTPLGDFDQNIVDLLSQDTVELKRGIPYGMYTFVTDYYLRELKQDQILESANLISEHMGTVGKRIDMEFTTTKSVYSRQYNIYFISAVMNGNQIMFAYKERLNSGDTYTAKGTVKAHRDNGVTQFNRVMLK